MPHFRDLTGIEVYPNPTTRGVGGRQIAFRRVVRTEIRAAGPGSHRRVLHENALALRSAEELPSPGDLLIVRAPDGPSPQSTGGYVGREARPLAARPRRLDGDGRGYARCVDPYVRVGHVIAVVAKKIELCIDVPVPVRPNVDFHALAGVTGDLGCEARQRASRRQARRRKRAPAGVAAVAGVGGLLDIHRRLRGTYDRQRRRAELARDSGRAGGAAGQAAVVGSFDPVAHRAARGVVAWPAQPEVSSSPPRWPATCSVPVAAGVIGEKSLRCSRSTAITPERPLLWAQVTRRPTPCRVSLPPPSSPLLAECTNIVPSRGGACAPAGPAASRHAASTATSTITLGAAPARQARRPDRRQVSAKLPERSSWSVNITAISLRDGYSTSRRG